MSWPRPIRVVGIGTPLGDDSLAWEAVRHLRRKTWPSDIEFYALEGGQRLLEVLDGRGSLVLIDALAPAGNPGAIRRFDWSDSCIQVLRPGSTHNLQPAEALQLAAALGLLPATIAMWGIEGETFDLVASSKATAAMTGLVRQIEIELEATLSAVHSRCTASDWP